jgi:hypothetical protein
MGVEKLPEVCSPLDPEAGRGDNLRLSLFRTNATQIFAQISFRDESRFQSPNVLK